MPSRAAKILKLVSNQNKCNYHADHDNEEPENQSENHGK